MLKTLALLLMVIAAAMPIKVTDESASVATTPTHKQTMSAEVFDDLLQTCRRLENCESLNVLKSRYGTAFGWTLLIVKGLFGLIKVIGGATGFVITVQYFKKNCACPQRPSNNLAAVA